MKLVETFLFSEEYEKELLLLKFILGNAYIDEWIVCENAYAHQGDFKGHIARNIVDSDPRFEPFRNKITFLEGIKQFEVIDKSKKQDDIAFKCENWQRSQAYNYFLEKYDDTDWLILHDVDETIDFTDEKRKDEFFHRLKMAFSKGCLVVPRRRYWYDFDNEYGIFYGSPLCTKKFIKNNHTKTLSRLRDEIAAMPLTGWKNIIAFEYSSCYSADHIIRKLNTTAHTGYTADDLKQSLRSNHRIITLSRMKEDLHPTKKYFFELVALNEENSPSYIRENIGVLKTNNIDPHYRQNRRIDYPYFYSFIPLLTHKIKLNLNTTTRKIRKKMRAVVYRLKGNKI